MKLKGTLTALAALVVVGGSYGGWEIWRRGGPKPLSKEELAFAKQIEKSLAMRSFASKAGPAGSFQVRVVSPKTCYMGDTDGILLDLNWRPQAKIWMTLERLGENAPPVAMALLEKERLGKPQELNLRIPRTRDMVDYGLYVCIESGEGSPRCADKAVMDYDAIFAQNSMKALGSDEAAKAYKDKMFFFNHVASNGRVVRLVTGAMTDDFKKFDALTDYLKLRSWSEERASATGARIKEISTKLGSLPLTVQKNDSIVVRMPIQDFASCGLPAR